jgi:hypothetical protein
MGRKRPADARRIGRQSGLTGQKAYQTDFL